MDSSFRVTRWSDCKHQLVLLYEFIFFHKLIPTLVNILILIITSNRDAEEKYIDNCWYEFTVTLPPQCCQPEASNQPEVSNHSASSMLSPGSVQYVETFHELVVVPIILLVLNLYVFNWVSLSLAFA